MNSLISASDAKSQQFWERSYRKAAKSALWGVEHVPFIGEIATRFVAKRCRHIIDVPCGDGRNLIYLSRCLPTIVGVDSSPTALKTVKRRLAAERITNCLLLKGDLFELPFEAEQFDGILCWDVLGHLQNVQRAITELLRICKGGGDFVGSLFALGDSTRGGGMRPLGDEEYIYNKECYFRFYSEGDVRHLLRDCGVRIARLDLTTWTEGPHSGYREHEHQHQSWVFTITK